MENLLEETRNIMRQYGVIADKKLGQNFLVNAEIIENIINGADLSENDLVIEIGPGLGTMTKYLSKVAGKVICIELDRRMINVLNNRFSNNNNIEIIYGALLKLNLREIIEKNSEYGKIKIVANLPYYITTPIIMKLLEDEINIDSITVMVQKEVADRIVAIPDNKDYGILTISIAYYASAENILQVPRQNFIPEPNVDSSVVKIDINNEVSKDILDKKTFFDIVKGGFAQRRKIFLNSIDSTLAKYNINKEDFKRILNKYNIDEMSRAENLSIQNFIDISNEIYNIEKVI